MSVTKKKCCTRLLLHIGDINSYRWRNARTPWPFVSSLQDDCCDTVVVAADVDVADSDCRFWEDCRHDLAVVADEIDIFLLLLLFHHHHDPIVGNAVDIAVVDDGVDEIDILLLDRRRHDNFVVVVEAVATVLLLRVLERRMGVGRIPLPSHRCRNRPIA